MLGRCRQEKRGSRTGAVLLGAGIGAALTYLLDPERGRRRRALLRDQATKAARQSGERLGSVSRDLRNRTQGVVIEAGKRLRPRRGEKAPGGNGGDASVAPEESTRTPEGA